LIERDVHFKSVHFIKSEDFFIKNDMNFIKQQGMPINKEAGSDSTVKEPYMSSNEPYILSKET